MNWQIHVVAVTWLFVNSLIMILCNNKYNPFSTISRHTDDVLQTVPLMDRMFTKDAYKLICLGWSFGMCISDVLVHGYIGHVTYLALSAILGIDRRRV